jgi:hypothetical protein
MPRHAFPPVSPQTPEADVADQPERDAYGEHKKLLLPRILGRNRLVGPESRRPLLSPTQFGNISVNMFCPHEISDAYVLQRFLKGKSDADFCLGI